MKKHIPRRTFLERGAVALGGVALYELTGVGQAPAVGGRSQVFFTGDITLDGLLRIYSKINGGQYDLITI
jgi:hypothetical protein